MFTESENTTMEKEVRVSKIIKRMKTGDFILNCRMPMGYVYGYPILQIRNDSLCMKVPFLKYKITGKPDQTLVFPIRYAVTIELPEERYVEFTDYAFDNRFADVDFEKAVGLFRHESIKNLTKKEYEAKRTELFGLYDKLAASLLSGAEFTAEDNAKMKSMLQMLVEPSLLPIYKILDKEFYEKYLRNDEV